jgi:hypothetical protein
VKYNARVQRVERDLNTEDLHVYYLLSCILTGYIDFTIIHSLSTQFLSLCIALFLLILLVIFCFLLFIFTVTMTFIYILIFIYTSTYDSLHDVRIFNHKHFIPYTRICAKYGQWLLFWSRIILTCSQIS